MRKFGIKPHAVAGKIMADNLIWANQTLLKETKQITQ
jgi:hypothetical protein